MPAALALVIAACCAAAQVAAPAAGTVPPQPRIVGCDESIDDVRFPYVGNRDPRYRARSFVDAVSVPPAHIPQSSPTESKPWTHFSKWGLVIRGGAGPDVLVTVPAAWRRRVAISWGNAQHRVFHALRFPRCGADRARGNAYAGGFFLRRAADSVPLRVTSGGRSRIVWFGIARRCR